VIKNYKLKHWEPLQQV